MTANFALLLAVLVLIFVAGIRLGLAFGRASNTIDALIEEHFREERP